MKHPHSKRLRVAAYATWLLVASPAVCHANVGLPMILVTLPMMVLGLLPIIVVEAAVALRYLKLPFRRLLKGTAIANLVSTFVGIPVAWLLLLAVQFMTGGGGAYGLSTPASRLLAVTWQAPWLLPYEQAFDWMVPAATIVLLVPFFLASWWIEYLVMKLILRDTDGKLLRRTVRNFNFLSYSGLAFCVIISMYFQ